MLSKGYEVYGIKRRSSLFNTDKIDHLYQDPHNKNIRFKLHYGNLNDSTNLIRIVKEIQPDEIMAIDKAYFRPTEVELLIGDPTKSKTKLGWAPKYDLAALVKEMVAADVVYLKRKHY